jgi:hypothetical protein
MIRATAKKMSEKKTEEVNEAKGEEDRLEKSSRRRNQQVNPHLQPVHSRARSDQR